MFALVVLVAVFFQCADAQHVRDPRRVHIPGIQNGRSAIPHSHPWMISFRGRRGHLCGGALIRICEHCNQSDIIITAAHCVVEMIKGDPLFMTKTLRPLDGLTVVAGLHWLDLVKDNNTYHVKSLKLYPAFDPLGPTGLRHDLAIVQTSRPIDFDENIRAIDLENYDGTESLTKSNETAQVCKVAGWGYTSSEHDESKTPADQLQEIDGRIVDGRECIKDHHPTVENSYDSRWMTCLASDRGQATTCGGDSGSAMVCASPTGPVAYGLVSFGGDHCGDKIKTVFTTIRPHLMWIYATAYDISDIAQKKFIYNALGVKDWSLI